jgi:large subunit ribosomal protein L10
MVLKRADKEQLVSDLLTTLRGVPAAVVVSFQALTMTESAALRRALRPSSGRMRVVPKRLFRRMVESLGWPMALADTSDSVAIAWSSDLLAPAKGVRAYVKASEGARNLGGVLNGENLDAAAVEQLALLPPMESLRAQLLGFLAGPMRGLVGTFGSVLRGLPAVLAAKS